MIFFGFVTTIVSYLKKPAKRESIKLALSLRAKTGLEVGGPSSFFSVRSYFPVYLFAKRIDFVNFSSSTIWEGKIEEGPTVNYLGTRIGFQYIREATDLSGVPDNHYDFVLSCHCLEHVANPLKALFEWNRVLKVNGKLILVLPDKTNTFDHYRPYTRFEHILRDYKNHTSEDDQTHFKEVIDLLDISKTETLKSKQELTELVTNNNLMRSVHHHVFDLALIKKMVDHAGFSVRNQLSLPPFHLFTYAIKR